MARSTILYIELAVPDAPNESLLDASKSWLLSGVSSYNDYKIYGFGAAGMKKGDDLGRLFDHLLPRTDGTFELELGVTLPDLLPNLNGHLDYSVEVALSDDDRHQLAVSNQMARINFAKDGAGYHLIFPRYHLDALKEDKTFNLPEGSSPQLLRSTITTRFSIPGKDAEDALEEHVERCIEKFTSLLNRLLASNQMIAEHVHSQFSTAYEATSFPFFYLIIAGETPGRFGHGKLSTHAGKMALNPPNVEQEKAERLLAYLQGAEPIDSIKQMITAARSSFEGGSLQFALLQMVIAAEMATSQYIRSRFLGLGVSRSKWNDVEAEITYSQMLNVHLFALTPAHLKPDRDLLGKMNRARDCRNKFMHRGDSFLTRDEALELINATDQYLTYLKRLRDFDLATETKKR